MTSCCGVSKAYERRGAKARVLPLRGLRSGVSRKSGGMPLMASSETVLERAVRSASVTRLVIVDPDAIGRLPHVGRTLGHAGACQVIADTNTMAAAGDRVLALLRSAKIASEEAIVLSETPRPKPRAETARDVGAGLNLSGALPIRVGPRVIN